MEAYREEKRKVKRCIYKSKREENEQFGRKMNQDMNGNRKLFWKMNNVNGRKDGSAKLALGGVEGRRIWKQYFENLYSIDTQEHVAVHICGFEGVRKGNYFGEESVRRTRDEVRVGKVKNEKATVKYEITGEMTKGGSDMVADWIWCNIGLREWCCG